MEAGRGQFTCVYSSPSQVIHEPFRLGCKGEHTMSTAGVDVQHLTHHTGVLNPEPRVYQPTSNPAASITVQATAVMAKMKYSANKVFPPGSQVALTECIISTVESPKVACMMLICIKSMILQNIVHS